MRELEDAKTAMLAAVAAADPTKLVKAQVRTGAIDDWLKNRDRPEMIHVLALGKAAPRMLWGLVEASVPFRGMGVTTEGQTKPLVDTFKWHVGGHPFPTKASFAAGQAVLDWVDALPADAPVLVLMSGGASACVESSDDPEACIVATRELVNAGLSTPELNQARITHSKIKGGRLGRRLADAGHDVRVWTMCDLPPEHVRLVGSGPFDIESIDHTTLADSSLLAEAAATTLVSLGYEVFGMPRIEGPIDAAVAEFCEPELVAGQVLLGHGESDVQVPVDAPAGGRCAHAAILGARAGELFFASASDGLDGTSRDMAAWSTGPIPDAGGILHRRAAHEYLSLHGQTLRMGATGTNLNDLWLRFPLTQRPSA